MRPSVRLKLKISVTTEPIGDIVNIDTGPQVVLSNLVGVFFNIFLIKKDWEILSQKNIKRLKIKDELF